MGNKVYITLGAAELPANGRCTVLVATGKSQCMLRANSAINASIALVLVLKEPSWTVDGACRKACVSHEGLQSYMRMGVAQSSGHLQNSKRAESQLCHACSDRPDLGLKRTGVHRGWCMPNETYNILGVAELHANGLCTILGPLANVKAH